MAKAVVSARPVSAKTVAKDKKAREALKTGKTRREDQTRSQDRDARTLYCRFEGTSEEKEKTAGPTTEREIKLLHPDIQQVRKIDQSR